MDSVISHTPCEKGIASFFWEPPGAFNNIDTLLQ